MCGEAVDKTPNVKLALTGVCHMCHFPSSSSSSSTSSPLHRIIYGPGRSFPNTNTIDLYPVGQILYDRPGTWLFRPPTGVTSVSAVCIGGELLGPVMSQWHVHSLCISPTTPLAILLLYMMSPCRRLEQTAYTK
jgi:hypothetical protein